MVDLVGVDHVGLGLDYFTGQSPYMSDEEATVRYQALVNSGRWSPAAYPPPPYRYPQGIETPDRMPNLTEGLLASGFTTQETQQILGGNWLRVFREVWGE